MLTSEKALQLYDAMCEILDGKHPSSHRTAYDSPNTEFDTSLPECWLKHKEVNSNKIKITDVLGESGKRKNAYLRFYVAMCGEHIPAAGIPTADGKYIYLDVGVMRSLLQYGMVTLEDNVFHLTKRGRAYLNGGAV